MRIVSPVMFDNTTPPPFVASASSSWSGFPPWRTFDGNIPTNLSNNPNYWSSGQATFSNRAGNENIQIDLGAETGFDRFVFYNGWNAGMVSDFELIGSNDGSVFNIITQDSGLLADSNLQQPTRREYNFATASYRFVRMRITRIVQDVTYCAVGLIQLFDTTSPPNEGWLIDEGRLLELRSLRPFKSMPIDREIGIPKALWRKIDTQNHGERLVIGWNEDSRLEILGACANASQLSEVVFPSTLKRLGRYAFRGAALTRVKIPAVAEVSDTSFPKGAEIVRI